jgi:hypothetical protein
VINRAAIVKGAFLIGGPNRAMTKAIDRIDRSAIRKGALSDRSVLPHGTTLAEAGRGAVGVAKCPASAIGGHHDDRTENYPR